METTMAFFNETEGIKAVLCELNFNRGFMAQILRGNTSNSELVEIENFAAFQELLKKIAPTGTWEMLF